MEQILHFNHCYSEKYSLPYWTDPQSHILSKNAIVGQEYVPPGFVTFMLTKHMIALPNIIQSRERSWL